jgi:uncharacterized protein YkwD
LRGLWTLVAIAFAGILLGCPLAEAQTVKSGAKSGAAQPRIKHLREIERQILRFTNEARRKHSLAIVDWDDDLRGVARAHSDDMLRRNFFSHDNFGKRVAPVVGATTFRAGENIFGGSGQDCSDARLLARNIVDGWMTSPGHRANILKQEYTHMGAGVSVLGKEIRATQVFTAKRSR